MAGDYLRSPRLQATTRISGRVSVVLGRYDPLVDPDAEAAIWTDYFPTATTCVPEAGHSIQFEADAAAWFRPPSVSSLRI